MKKKQRMSFSRLTGPLLSILIHAGIILLLALFVGHFIKPVEEERPPEITWQQKPLDPSIFEPDIDVTIDEPHPAPDDQEIIFTPPVIERPKMDTNAPKVVRSRVSIIELPTVLVPTVVTHEHFGPRSGPEKAEALHKHAKDHAPVTKRSVYLALNWLKDHQRSDGSWEGKGRDSVLASTGLATLSFLANGFTPDHSQYGATVEKAMRYLVAEQGKDGLWGREYSHAICTYALAEGYAMTHIYQLREALNLAVPHITNGLNIRQVARTGSMRPVRGLDQPRAREVAAGLWDYKYKTDSGRFDTSVSGWQIQALKAVKMTNINDPQLDRALQLASNGLKSLQAERSGKIGYTSTGDGSAWMTGVGALSLMMTGDRTSPELERAFAAVANETCVFATAKPSSLYGWYYLTQVKFHEQGSAWSSWRGQFVREYARNQERDGSWKSPSGGEGHGNENQYGRAYTTSLGVLTMSVFYRSKLMTNDGKAFEIAERPPVAATDPDIELQF